VPTCPPLAVTGFTLRGLTVKHASFSGVFLIGVDGYHLTGTSYVDNPVYGPFPVCSRNGLIDYNQVVGGGSAAGPSTDTGIYAGDDDGVTIRNNSVANYVVGAIAENTINANIQDNLLSGNTAGVYVVVLPNHPRPFTDHVLIEGNQVIKNNLPNPRSLPTAGRTSVWSLLGWGSSTSAPTTSSSVTTGWWATTRSA
jgi:hypothetical protein